MITKLVEKLRKGEKVPMSNVAKDISNPGLRRYAAEGFDKIDGWCDRMLFTTIDLLNSTGINKSGGCAEIGVHMGKFYILLNSVISAEEQSYAIDVFDQQQLNVDHSGGGVLDTFQQNLRQYDAHSGTNTVIINGDSTDPKRDSEIRKGSLRFISIDGGHTAEHTINDLNLAAKWISNEGVVIVDDILSYHWLGVVEGVFIFLYNKPCLVPFAIGHNKMYFCKLSYKIYYFDLFRKLPQMTKTVNFCGHTIAAL